jgi:hypothetical protein
MSTDGKVRSKPSEIYQRVAQQLEREGITVPPEAVEDLQLRRAADLEDVIGVLFDHIPPEHRGKLEALTKEARPERGVRPFALQILNFETRKIDRNAHGYGVNSTVFPTTSEFIMPKDAGAVIQVNNELTDSERRQPITKIVARDGFEVYQLDLDKLGLRYSEGESSNDVQVERVGTHDADVKIIDDTASHDKLGDNGVWIVVDRDGNELERTGRVPQMVIETASFQRMNGNPSVPDLDRPIPNGRSEQSGPQFDQPGQLGRAVTSFRDRIQLHIASKTKLDKTGAWLSSPATDLDMSLLVAPGLLRAFGKDASISFLGTTLQTRTEDNDFDGKGSPRAHYRYDLASDKRSIEQVLREQLVLTTASRASGLHDRTSQQEAGWAYVYPHRDQVEIAGAKFAPLSTTSLASKEQIKTAQIDASLTAGLPEGSATPSGDSTTLHLTLAPGLLKASEPADLEGYTVVVGYFDKDNQWVQNGSHKIESWDASQKMHFDVPIADTASAFANKNVEIQIFNRQGIPAQRVAFPFKLVDWK